MGSDLRTQNTDIKQPVDNEEKKLRALNFN